MVVNIIQHISDSYCSVLLALLALFRSANGASGLEYHKGNTSDYQQDNNEQDNHQQRIDFSLLRSFILFAFIRRQEPGDATARTTTTAAYVSAIHHRRTVTLI